MAVDLLAIRDVGILLFLALVYVAVLVALKATQLHKTAQRDFD